MAYVYKQAFRKNISTLTGFAGYTGSGKTRSAMAYAQGIVGRKEKFLVIDTESGRALSYAPLEGEEPDFNKTFLFDYDAIEPPFRPDKYQEAIIRGDKAGYRVIVIDSFSHEYYGDGGVIDWHDEILETLIERIMKKNPNADEWKIRESNNMRAWVEPKVSHKKMVQRLLQCKAHLVFCLRAEPKIDITKDENGKTVIVPKKSVTGLDGWIPICEKNFPYELTCSFLLHADKPGYPRPIKLQEQHKAFFPLDRPITEESGRLIAQWAAGGKIEKSPKSPVEQKTGKSDTPEKGVNGKVSPQATGETVDGKNRLYPQDWEKLRTTTDKKIESKWRDLKGETLAAMIEGKDKDQRQFAQNELRFRVVKFGEFYAKAGQKDDWEGATCGGDVAQIPIEELAGVAQTLANGWKKLSEKN